MASSSGLSAAFSTSLLFVIARVPQNIGTSAVLKKSRSYKWHYRGFCSERDE